MTCQKNCNEHPQTKTVNRRGRKQKLTTTVITKKDQLSKSFLFWEDTYFCEHPLLFRSQRTAFALQCTVFDLHWLWVRRRLQTELLPYVMPQLFMWCIFKVLKTNTSWWTSVLFRSRRNPRSKLLVFLIITIVTCFKSASTTHNINVNDTAMVLYLITAHVVAYIHNYRLSPIVTFSYIQALLWSHILELHKQTKKKPSN